MSERQIPPLFFVLCFDGSSDATQHIGDTQLNSTCALEPYILSLKLLHLHVSRAVCRQGKACRAAEQAGHAGRQGMQGRANMQDIGLYEM